MVKLPTVQTNQATAQAIRDGAVENKEVRIRYRDDKDKISERSIEPYEMKNGKLFGYCINKGGIRAFKTTGIEVAVVTDKPFKPRFPVQITEQTYIK